MATWTEIERVKNDAEEARRIAAAVLRHASESGVLTEWEFEFLEGTRDSRVEELSTRWAEKLLEIRDDVQRVSLHHGISIGRLIKGCHEGRADLAEGDDEEIVRAYEEDPTSIRKRQLPWLLRCARQLGLIESYLAA